MKLFIHPFLTPISFRKELLQSMWIHGSFFVGLLLFVLISPQAPFRSEKYISVNLKNLGGPPGNPSGSPASRQKATPAMAPVKTPLPVQKTEIKKPAPPQPKVEQKKPPTPTPPQPQQKIQKLAPKSQKTPPPTQAKPQPKTPSLSERLKNRFDEVKSVESTKKFVEPQKFVEAQQAAAASKHRFIEPGEWSKIQKSQEGSQTQMAAVGMGTGTGSGSGSGDGKVFPFAWYLEMIQNKITMNWKEPPKPALDSTDLSAVVSFTILRDGQIQNISVVESSSMQSLNQTVVEAVKASNPLPPLPADFTGNRLNVKIKFELTE